MTRFAIELYRVRIGLARLAAILLTLSLTWAQNPTAPAREETAPAIPVEEPALVAAVDATKSGSKTAGVVETEASSGSSSQVTDYTNQIGTGLKERERRLTLLNEAMMKLREAGETEDAGRVEERIRSLLEMPAPSQAGGKLRAEIEQLRAKNDELALQQLALQEELKRYRGGSSKESARNR